MLTINLINDEQQNREVAGVEPTSPKEQVERNAKYLESRIESLFMEGANQCLQDDEDKADQRESAYPEGSVARHWWARGYAHQSRAFRGVELAAKVKGLEAQLEQFARDIAAKLDMAYEPPVSKGECAYLVALEALKERAEAAEKVAAFFKNERDFFEDGLTRAMESSKAAEARAEAAEKKLVEAKDACANLGAELAMAVNALPERRVAGLMAAFRELEGTL